MNDNPPKPVRIGYLCAPAASPLRGIYRNHLTEQGCMRVFEDEPGEERPRLAETLDFIRTGDELMVWRVNHLPTRSHDRYRLLLDDLKSRGVTLVSYVDELNTRSAEGRLRAELALASAAIERLAMHALIQSGHTAADTLALMAGPYMDAAYTLVGGSANNSIESELMPDRR